MTEGISIAIPTYGYRGKGSEFLQHSLHKISNQTFNNIEVVVSDDSTDDSIYKCLSLYKNLNIKYYKSVDIGLTDRPFKTGMTPNINRAMSMCTKELIHILFQDDFIYDQHSVQSVYTTFKNSDCKWVASGFIQTPDGTTITRTAIPQYHPKIYLGENSMSSPSIITIINDDIELFDEKLLMLMDCEYYKRLELKYGYPAINQHLAVAIRQHPDQISNNEGTEPGLIAKEIDYVRKIYENE